jgi:tetratricopeptide (TPR) repeat protein
VAAYHIDKVIIEGKAEVKAAATVLPIEAILTEGPPFVGRESEMQRVSDMLSAQGDTAADNVLIISGPPGVGKTAILSESARAAHAAGRFSEVLFVDLRGYADDPDMRVHPDAVLSSLLLLLGVEDDGIPLDPASQAILYHRRLDQLALEGNSVLLWLDNAGDRSQFDTLRPASPVHKMAVTTRETFGHIPNRLVVEIDVMSIEDALLLLETSAREHNPADTRFGEQKEDCEQLASLCDRLPLALQIVAALLADEPERPIAELVSEMSSEEDRLSSLDYSTDLSVRTALSLSYRRLPEDRQRLFRLLSVVPGGDVGLETAGWLIGAPHTAVRPQLMALVRSHLVLQHVRNRWSMHDLIRLFSAELSVAEPDDSSRAFKSITQRYLVGVAAAAEWLTTVVSPTARRLFTSPEHASAWFEAERPTAIAIVESLAKRDDEYDLTVAFTIALGEVLKSQRHWLNDFHHVTEVGASVVMRAPNKRNGAYVLNLYGAALRNLGRLDEAADVLERARSLGEESGDVNAGTAALSNLGNVLFNQGRIDEALAVYWEDVRASRESDPPHRFNEAIALSNIGAALGNSGRYAEAIAPLEESLTIRRDLDDVPGIASAAKNLGGALIGLGRQQNNRQHLQRALVVLREAAEIYQQRGNRSGTADVANNVGQAQCMLGQVQEGTANLRTALEYFEQTGQDDLAAQVREDIESYGRLAAQQARQGAQTRAPWTAEPLGSDRFRFTNTSGLRLAMVVLTPANGTAVRVEDGVADDPHVVPVPVNAGSNFIALVRGRGLRITATAVPSTRNVYWDFAL